MNIQKNILSGFKYFPAMTSGLILTLSFPRPGLWFLAFFALVPMILSIGSMTQKESFYSGFITGFFHFTTLVYWIVPTLNTYGGLHMVIAVSILILLCFYLSLYPAMFALLIKKMNPGLFYFPLAAASLWTGLEYIRTHAFTGFSWGALGYSQYENISFIQVADFSGVYGVSFLIVLINGLAAVMWTGFFKNKKKKIFVPAAEIIILVYAVLLYGHQRINTIHFQIKAASKTRITLVQGNIKQDFKWSEKFKASTIEKYIRLSRMALKKQSALNKPDLVIWPETALPFYYGLDRALSSRVDECIRSSKTNFLIGSPALKSDGKHTWFYNRAYMLNQLSIVTGTYDKYHLVPFGEYVPFGNILSFLGKLTAQAGNFSPGDKKFYPLVFNHHKTGVLICFDILFPSIASSFVKNGADLLTTITNDAWFGRTPAAMQHFSIAVLRAVENRRTIARAANTGISGFIDPTGKILETTGLFTDRTITRQVPALTTMSFYTKYGDIFAISSLVAFCMAFMLKRYHKKH